jgi:pentapeptide MXKDX repeat protein
MHERRCLEIPTRRELRVRPKRPDHLVSFGTPDPAPAGRVVARRRPGSELRAVNQSAPIPAPIMKRIMTMKTRYAIAAFAALALVAAAPLFAAAASAEETMKSETPAQEHMKGDAMKGDHMKGDAMKGDHMKGDAMKGDHMKGDAMKGATDETQK